MESRTLPNCLGVEVPAGTMRSCLELPDGGALGRQPLDRVAAGLELEVVDPRQLLEL